MASSIRQSMMTASGIESTRGSLKKKTATTQVMLTGKPILKQLTAQQLAAATEIPGAIGNVNRPSASLLYVPLQIGPRIIGVLSVQSYRAQCLYQ